MAADGIDVFIRWVLRHGVTSERTRPLVTLATFLSDDERLAGLQREAPIGSLDEALMDEFLSLADPQETVTLLAFRIGPYISPEMFRNVFERTLAASADIEVLSGLMFVAGLYLDRHPGAFPLPRKGADQLLASADLDHRLAGLKALRHSMASSSEIIAQIIVALKRDDWQERWAGLSQLAQLLEQGGSQLAEATEQKTLAELRNVLTQVANIAPDTNARRAAAHCIALLWAADDTQNG